MLVHYLNVPAVDDSGKPCGPVLCSINTDRKEWAKWSKEELIGQLKPMCELVFPSLPNTHLPPTLKLSCFSPHTFPKPEKMSHLGSIAIQLVMIMMEKMLTKPIHSSKLNLKETGVLTQK